MFISSKQYLEAIACATATNQPLSIAVAFWGNGSEVLLKDATGQVRIICNLLTGGTNPRAISTLLARRNFEIRHSSILHAKVLLCADRAIVGSANFSANGLHYEGEELGGWDEAGIETRDPSSLRSIADWFETLWRSSSILSGSDIALAEARWRVARDNRGLQSASMNILDLPVSAFKDRQIYFAFWRDEPSAEAIEVMNSILKEADETIERNAENGIQLDFYESWEDLPLNSAIIDVKVGVRSAVTVGGIFRRVPALDRHFQYGDGSNGSLQVVLPEADLLGFSFDGKAKRHFERLLRPHIRDIMNRTGESGQISACVPLYDLLTR